MRRSRRRSGRRSGRSRRRRRRTNEGGMEMEEEEWGSMGDGWRRNGGWGMEEE